jgi:hypothetical protein
MLFAIMISAADRWMKSWHRQGSPATVSGTTRTAEAPDKEIDDKMRIFLSSHARVAHARLMSYKVL